MPKTAIIATEVEEPATPGEFRFSYESLPADRAEMIRKVTARLRTRASRRMQDLIENGRDLAGVKEILDHGQFESWLGAEFGMTARTAQKYMLAAEWMAGKPELGSGLTPSIVYLLSAKSTPKKIAAQVIGKIKDGERVKPQVVRGLIADARYEDRQADKKAQQKVKRTKRYRERQEEERRKDLERRARQDEAAQVTAMKVVEILTTKLTDGELTQVMAVFGGGWDVQKKVADALKKAVPEPGKVTVKPRKPRKKRA